MRRLCIIALGIAACGGPLPEVPATEPEPTPEVPAPVEVCEEELELFDAQVNRTILVPKCAPCHNPAGPALASRLHLSSEMTPEAVKANWQAAAFMARLQIEGDSELVLRATGTHPAGHGGGAPLQVGSRLYDALVTFIDRAIDPECNRPPEEGCEVPPYGPRLLRRLVPAEYDLSLEALFGRTSTRGASLAVDPSVGGFANHGPSLVVGSLLADQLRLHAEEIAEQVVQDLDSLLPCTPTADTEVECRNLFIRRFIAKVYRRVPTLEEVQRYTHIFEQTAQGDFSTGLKWVVTAALQSPHFLYRSELGVKTAEGYELTNHEIASALSYFLTGGPPDEILLSSAALGQLVDPAARVVQARRLLTTPAGQRASARFFFAWLGLGRTQTVAKDQARFSEFSPVIRESMKAETEHFIRWVMLRGGGTLTDLLSAPYSFMNADLEAFYGESGQGERDVEGFRQVLGSARFGLLTQGSLLSVHALPDEGSPIHRGKMVRERLLCQPLEPPPPGVVVQPPPLDPNLTARERYAAHSAVEPCRSCHRLIDPIGHGFSNYDAVGRYRSHEAGRPVDAHGGIVDTAHTDGMFADLGELASMLAESPDVQACFVRRWQQWAYGLGEEEGLQQVLKNNEALFSQQGLRVDALLIGLARSQHMQTRTATMAVCP